MATTWAKCSPKSRLAATSTTPPRASTPPTASSNACTRATSAPRPSAGRPKTAEATSAFARIPGLAPRGECPLASADRDERNRARDAQQQRARLRHAQGAELACVALKMIGPDRVVRAGHLAVAVEIAVGK